MKYKAGDKVKIVKITGNNTLGYSHLIGTIASISYTLSEGTSYPYVLKGVIGYWQDEELELVGKGVDHVSKIEEKTFRAKVEITNNNGTDVFELEANLIPESTTKKVISTNLDLFRSLLNSKEKTIKVRKKRGRGRPRKK